MGYGPSIDEDLVGQKVKWKLNGMVMTGTILSAANGVAMVKGDDGKGYAVAYQDMDIFGEEV